MATTSWTINGEDLDTSIVYVTVEPMTLKADQAVRIQQDRRLHDLARRHVLGRDLPIYGFRFKVHGPAFERTQRVNYIRALLRTSNTWRLSAPSEPNQVYFNDGSKEIDLTTVSTSLVYGTGTAVIALDIVALEPAPEDGFVVPGEEGTLTRGIAQVFIPYCFDIGEETVSTAANAPLNASAFQDVINVTHITQNLQVGTQDAVQEQSGKPTEQVAISEGLMLQTVNPQASDLFKNQP